jgi:hypothetical protein
MPEYYERYGFEASPFGYRALDTGHAESLDAQVEKHRLLLDIDGFASLAACQDYLRERRTTNKPAFVVIVGAGKSGLSLAAAAVLLKYREVTGISATQFIPVIVAAEDHSEPKLYTRWIAALFDKLNPRLSLESSVAKRFEEARRLTDPATIDYDLRSVLRDVTPALTGRTLTFGTALERVRTLKVIQLAKTIFDELCTTCVFTCQSSAFDESSLARLRDDPDIHLIELRPLNAEEASRIFEARWGATSPPLHVETFGRFCEERNHTVGVVLRMADGVLRKRVKDAEAANGGTVGRWPHDISLGTTSKSETRLLLEVVSYGG